VQATAELEPEVRVTQQLTQTIIDDPAHKLIELILRELREVHGEKGYGGERLKSNWSTGVLV
jgi:hypothetical protein